MSNVTVVPGEMRLWTDCSDTGPRPLPSSAASATVLGGILRQLDDNARVLIAGPHGSRLLSTAERSGRSVSVLVRSLADANHVSDSFPGFDVYCGGLAAFQAEGYDLVVALDGVERLASVDEPPSTWVRQVDHLRSLLREGGVLLLAVENLFSPQRMSLALRTGPAPWSPAEEWDDTRPASAADLRGLAGGWDMRCDVLALAPFATDFRLALREDLANGRVRDARILEALRQCHSSLTGEVQRLFDPTEDLIRAARRGSFGAMAPGWLAVLTKARERRLVPGAVWLDSAYGAPEIVVERTQPDVLDTVRASRNPGTGAGRFLESFPRVPVHHPTVAERLVSAVATDMVDARRLVSRYLEWLADQPVTGLPVPSNVVIAEDSLQLLDPSLTFPGQPQLSTVVGVGAFLCAEILMRPECRHQWPSWVGVKGLAAALVRDRLPIAPERDFGEEVDWDETAHLLSIISEPTGSDGDEIGDLNSARAALAEARRYAESLNGRLEAHERLERIRADLLAKRTAEIADLKRRLSAARTRADRLKQRLGDTSKKRRWPLLRRWQNR